MALELIRLESTTLEKLLVTWETRGDPTAVLPEFSITSGPESDPSSWVNGEWAPDGFSARSGLVTAYTPTIGSGGDLDITQGETYDLWMRFTFGTEKPTRVVAKLKVD